MRDKCPSPGSPIWLSYPGIQGPIPHFIKVTPVKATQVQLTHTPTSEELCNSTTLVNPSTLQKIVL